MDTNANNLPTPTNTTWYIAPADDHGNEYAAGYDGNSFATREEAEAVLPLVAEGFGTSADDWVVVERSAEDCETWTLRDPDSGHRDTYVGTLHDATNEAHRLARSADWGMDSPDATAICVRTHLLDSEGDLVTVVDTIVEPREPRCDGRRDHDWAAGDVQGHGAGVRSVDECSCCGMRRHWTTWFECDGHLPVPGHRVTVRYEAKQN